MAEKERKDSPIEFKYSIGQKVKCQVLQIVVSGTIVGRRYVDFGNGECRHSYDLQFALKKGTDLVENDQKILDYVADKPFGKLEKPHYV